MYHNEMKIGTIETKGENRYASIAPVRKKAYYQLSLVQRRLYFLQQMEESTEYNISSFKLVEGAIDKKRLEDDFKKLINRHEGLRTSFTLMRGKPVQKIHDNLKVRLEYYDSKEKQEEIIRKFVRPFNLTKPPLFRIGLINNGKDKYILMVDMHRIISDDISLNILLRDFMALYSGEELPALKLQYKDYAEFQNCDKEMQRIKRSQVYWLNEFQEEVPVLPIPTDYPESRTRHFNDNEVRLEIDGSITTALRRLAVNEDVTLHMLLFTIYSVFLSKISNQEDIVIGNPISGRMTRELGEIIGPFGNTLPLRNFASGEKNFIQLLKQIRGRASLAFENQEYHYEALLEQIVKNRDEKRTLFNTVFILSDEHDPELTVKGLKLLPYRYENNVTKFDLVVRVPETGHNLSFLFKFRAKMFNGETIERYVKYFKTITANILKEPGTRISQIELLSDEEKEQLLYDFNNKGSGGSYGTAYTYRGVKLIHKCFEEQAKQMPGNIAAQYENEFLTYSLLDKESDKLASYFCIKKDVKAGDRIGILMERSIHLVTAILGILKSGAAYVPIALYLPEERIKNIIEDAEIGIVLSQKKHTRTLNRLQWECTSLHTIMCMDSMNICGEGEEDSGLRDKKLWEYVGESAEDEVTGGGWISSYTGEPLSIEEMDEYGDNILEKLRPILHKEMRVLEIGCATGFSMYRIAPKVGLYYGTDLSEVIIKKNELRIRDDGFDNIKLACLAAHEIEKVEEKNFDLVIMNSVIQEFHDHNYLRAIIRKVTNLLKNKGFLFIGDIMDLDKKQELITDLANFKNAPGNKNYRTKTDWSAELFISRAFFEDLCVDMPEIRDIEFTEKIRAIENELTRFRYDALIMIDKSRGKTKAAKTKHKYQEDLRALENLSVEKAESQVTPDDLAYVIYTSGTTGTPKGVMIEHKSVINLLMALQQAYPFKKSDTFLLKTSYVFDVSVAELFGWFSGGGRLVLLKNGGEKDPQIILDTVKNARVTHINFVPSMFSAFVGFLSAGNILKLASLKYIFLAGEALLPEFVRKFRALNSKIRLENLYGPTEATVYAAKYSLSEWKGNGKIPIGEPIRNLRVYILDKYKNLQPIGTAGELYISGIGLARGYLNSPSLTGEKFMEDPFVPGERIYRTGDMTRWLRDGNIEFLGRLDDQVKIRGYRIELGEIESQLLRHGDIKEVVVAAREAMGTNGGFAEHRDKSICAYFVSNVELSGSELKGFLAKSLPEYMIPLHFVQLKRLPLTSSGKVNKKVLPAPGLISQKGYTAPGNEQEEAIVKIWSQILGINEAHISTSESFFKLGGHSLKAIDLITRIHKEFNVMVPFTEVFKGLTIIKLSAYISKADKSLYSSIEPAEKKECYKLSSAQKRMFILQKKNPGTLRYNIPTVFVMKGVIDKDKLSDTFVRLMERHESFRTSFELNADDEPIQRVHKKVPFELEYFELKNNLEREKEIRKAFIRPFDLFQPPLLRVGLIRKKEETYLLMTDMHHIISDGISLDTLIKDFVALFREETLPTLKLQYKDYSEWQYSEKAREAIKKQEQYWLRDFNGRIPLLQLPTDYARPAVQSFEGNTIGIKISREEAAALKDLGLKEGATLFMILLAVCNVLLSKISNQEDIIIGTPVSGRRYAELQQIIGVFINALALRNYPQGEKTFREFLNEVKRRTVEAFENQDYYFEDLVEKVVKFRDPSRHPLFDVGFGVEDIKIPELAIEGVKVQSYSLEDSSIAKNDLSVFATEVDGDLSITFGYCTRLFKEKTIRVFMEYFRKIISDIVEDPGKKLSEMGITTGDKKKNLQHQFTDNLEDE